MIDAFVVGSAVGGVTEGRDADRLGRPQAGDTRGRRSKAAPSPVSR